MNKYVYKIRKIASGEVSNNLFMNLDQMGVPKFPPMAMKKKERSFSETVCPQFISSKQVKESQLTPNNVYFDPPLLPKVLQSSEPSFFAGAELQYELPERLPEDVLQGRPMVSEGCN